jgi:hypothetical protein
MGDAGWRRRLDRAVYVYVDAVASEPEFARTFHLEVLAAGARAMQRRAEVLGRFADALRLAHIAARREDPSLPEVSDELLAGLVGGIHELVLERIRAQGPGAVPELHSAFVDFAVAVLGRA